MEMSKRSSGKPTTSSERVHPSPSPFSSEAERHQLERELLMPPPPSAFLASSTNYYSEFHPLQPPRQSLNASHCTENEIGRTIVPTAVAIIDDTFDENGAPSMAMATATPMPNASLAASMSSASHSSSTNGAISSSHCNQYTSKPPQPVKSTKISSYDDGIEVRPEPPPPSSIESTNNTAEYYSYPLAHSVPPAPTTKSSPHSALTKEELKKAQEKGEISSKLEHAGIARGNRAAKYGEQYDTNERVRAANSFANRKVGQWDEGLTVDERSHPYYVADSGSSTGVNGVGGKEGVVDDVRPYGTVDEKTGKRGYEVAEYDVKEYDCGEYDVMEYKSVYD